MEWIGEIFAALGTASLAGGFAWRRSRAIAKQGFELYRSLNALRIHVTIANKDGDWSKEEGAKAGELAVDVADEFGEFMTEAKKSF